MFGVKYGHFYHSATYCIQVQYGTIDNWQEAFHDLIESTKVGRLCRLYYTTLQCSGGQQNTRAPASPAVYTSVLYLWKVGILGHPIAVLNAVQLGFCVLALTQITRWINHFQRTGIANTAFILWTQATSCQEFLLPIKLSDQPHNQIFQAFASMKLFQPFKSPKRGKNATHTSN